MRKLCINNRDEMVMIPIDNIAYILAEGNYTKICYLGGMQTMLSLGISKVETMIGDTFAGSTSPFIRLGRSLIINQIYLYDINLLKQTLTLSDCKKSTVHLKLPKPLLKKYKDLFSNKSTLQNKK